MFDLAGKYGLRIISMEVTHESHVEQIQKALAESGHATGVMLQIGKTYINPSASAATARTILDCVLMVLII